MKNTAEFSHITDGGEAVFIIDGYRARSGFISKENMEYMRRCIESESCEKAHVVVNYPCDRFGSRNYKTVRV